MREIYLRRDLAVLSSPYLRADAIARQQQDVHASVRALAEGLVPWLFEGKPAGDDQIQNAKTIWEQAYGGTMEELKDEIERTAAAMMADVMAATAKAG